MRDTESELFNSEAWLTASVCLPLPCARVCSFTHSLCHIAQAAPHYISRMGRLPLYTIKEMMKCCRPNLIPRRYAFKLRVLKPCNRV